MRHAARTPESVLTKTEDASYTLFSERYGQTYHSSFGAASESMHVFVRGSNVYERLKHRQPTRVLEIGFGLGLNCLLCADAAERYGTPLHYTGIEHSPISAESFDQLHYRDLLQQPMLADALGAGFDQIEQRLQHDKHHTSQAEKSARDDCEEPLSSNQRLCEYVDLTLVVADVSKQKCPLSKATKFDAIFLDAFSPDTNPECWTKAFFDYLATLLAPHGRLATYCVKGVVRRNLQAVGFHVHKYPGPAGKREVLWAALESPQS